MLLLVSVLVSVGIAEETVVMLTTLISWEKMLCMQWIAALLFPCLRGALYGTCSLLLATFFRH